MGSDAMSVVDNDGVNIVLIIPVVRKNRFNFSPDADL